MEYKSLAPGGTEQRAWLLEKVDKGEPWMGPVSPDFGDVGIILHKTTKDLEVTLRGGGGEG